MWFGNRAMDMLEKRVREGGERSAGARERYGLRTNIRRKEVDTSEERASASYARPWI